jgi:hypothetical protein
VHVKAEWQLQDAKTNFSRVLNRFERLVARKYARLADFLARSALCGLDIDVRDHADAGREAVL